MGPKQAVKEDRICGHQGRREERFFWSYSDFIDLSGSEGVTTILTANRMGSGTAIHRRTCASRAG